MDEALLALLGTFAEIERELGRRAFEDVVERARVAVAHEIMVEAERRALRHRPRQIEGNIVSFPKVGDSPRARRLDTED